MRKKATIKCWTNVFSDHHVAIMDLVSLKDGPNDFLVDLRKFDCGIDLFTFSKARPAEGISVCQRTVIYRAGQRRSIKWCRPLTPPADFCLKTTVRMRIQSEQLANAYRPSGLDLLRRIPTASSSASRSRRCSTDLVASSIMRTRSAVFATS